MFGNGQQISFRSVDAAFPDYRQVIPENNDKHIVIDKKKFLAELELSLIAANQRTHQAIMNVDLVTSLFSEDIGKAKFNVELHCHSEGKIKIGFNAKFMIDSIKDLDYETIRIDMSTPSRAMILNNQVLIMPMPCNA